MTYIYVTIGTSLLFISAQHVGVRLPGRPEKHPRTPEKEAGCCRAVDGKQPVVARGSAGENLPAGVPKLQTFSGNE